MPRSYAVLNLHALETRAVDGVHGHLKGKLEAFMRLPEQQAMLNGGQILPIKQLWFSVRE